MLSDGRKLLVHGKKGLGTMATFGITGPMMALPFMSLYCLLKTWGLSKFGSSLLDALDGLEFAMGSEESTWGSIRAAMGHPERFPLKYAAIGNEECLKEFYQDNELVEFVTTDEQKCEEVLVQEGVPEPSVADFADTPPAQANNSDELSDDFIMLFDYIKQVVDP
ncbi:uncharacterized protein [Miscanthus floridulus]|uniref:uncharacterized protein n=1 Tax=Miscanthus floridulus TaxID=154761 RepID=UPI003458DA18